MIINGNTITDGKIYSIITRLNKNGVLEIDKRSHYVNIIGIRTDKSNSVNSYNDYILTAIYKNGTLNVNYYYATTEPFDGEVKANYDALGNVWVKEGFYQDLFFMNTLHGQKALFQKGIVSYYYCRKNNRPKDLSVLPSVELYTDLTDKKSVKNAYKPLYLHGPYLSKVELDFKKTVEHKPPFGLKSIVTKTTKKEIEMNCVIPDGCQCIESQTDYDAFIHNCNKHLMVIGNTFNYTLIDEKDFK